MDGGPWCLPAHEEMLRAVGRKPNSPALEVCRLRGREMALEVGGGCGAVNTSEPGLWCHCAVRLARSGRLLIMNVTRQV